MFLDNKYTKWYYQIIERAIKANRRKNKEIYYESHHVIPKCKPFNGTNSKENQVLLTAREHFICHWLLTKMCIGIFRIKMLTSLTRMMGNHNTYSRWSSYQYEIARKFNLEYLKQPKTEEHKNKIRLSNLGLKRSEEARRNISASAKRRKINGFQGKHHSEESKAKISAAKRGTKQSEETRRKRSETQRGEGNPFFGKSHTEETKKILREKSRTMITCPHCLKTGMRAGMKRHHFERCKLRTYS